VCPEKAQGCHLGSSKEDEVEGLDHGGRKGQVVLILQDAGQHAQHGAAPKPLHQLAHNQAAPPLQQPRPVWAPKPACVPHPLADMLCGPTAEDAAVVGAAIRAPDTFPVSLSTAIMPSAATSDMSAVVAGRQAAAMVHVTCKLTSISQSRLAVRASDRGGGCLSRGCGTSPAVPS
jgi:hypothetical protein